MTPWQNIVKSMETDSMMMPTKGKPASFPTSKTCTCCGVHLPLSEFHARTKSSDGVRSHCKKCVAEKQRH